MNLSVRLDEGEGKAALVWLDSFLSGYDTSMLSRFTIDHGNAKRTRYGIWGVCRPPEPGVGGIRSTYRISCHIGAEWPYAVRTRKPIVRAGSVVREGRLGITTLYDADEAIVWLTSHEMLHYLRWTDQVSGMHTETLADAFADARLAEFRGRPKEIAGITLVFPTVDVHNL